MSFWLFPGISTATDLEVTYDAAGSLGFGAHLRGEWFSGAWMPCHAEQSIAYKELFPIIIAAHIWAGSGSGRISYSIRITKQLYCLMLCLMLPCLMSCFSFIFTAQHVPGVHNKVTDALSRFHWQEFRLLAPEAQLSPVVAPRSLLEELTHPLWNGNANNC